MSLQIRTATQHDEAAIRRVNLDAFDSSERDAVARLAVQLLSETSDPEVHNYVAEFDGAIVGHVAFSPTWNAADGRLLGYILAPLCVSPLCQRKAIGTKLVQHGIDTLKREQIPAVFVYGDPAYYGRFGFSVDLATRYTAPYPLQYPEGWQAIQLSSKVETLNACELRCVTALSEPSLW